MMSLWLDPTRFSIKRETSDTGLPGTTDLITVLPRSTLAGQGAGVGYGIDAAWPSRTPSTITITIKNMIETDIARRLNEQMPPSPCKLSLPSPPVMMFVAFATADPIGTDSAIDGIRCPIRPESCHHPDHRTTDRRPRHHP